MTPGRRTVLERHGLFGSSLDLDFENARYFQSGVGSDIDKLITTSRASTAYADDMAGNWTSFDSNVARITNKGLLVEEARTNSIRNNSMQGAVAGTPGTAPTNWTISTFAGVAVSVIGTGTDAGIDYIDIRWVGTAGSNIVGGLLVKFEADTQIAASNGQTWTQSVFHKLVGGGLTGVTFISGVRELSGAGAFLAQTVSGMAPMPSWGRASNTRTNNNASTAFENATLGVNWTSGTVVDLTLRIGWPQLELGAFATSPIRTTSAAATRAADVVTVTTPPTFGSAYTLFGKGTPYAPASYPATQFPLSLSDGSVANMVAIVRTTAGNAQGSYAVSGSTTGTTPGLLFSQNASAKTAYAAQSGDQVFALNGSATSTSAVSGTPVGLNKIQIGAGGDELSPFDGYIERVALWPNTRLPNADLQRLTSA